MKRTTTSLFPFLLFLGFLTSCLPVKQGFNHLEAGRKEQARDKFEKAATIPDQAPAAAYGLYKLGQYEDYFTIQAAYYDLTAAAVAYDSLPAKRRQFYEKAKKIQLTGRSFRTATARLQGKALLAVEEAESLLLLDSLYFNMSPLADRLLPKYEALEDSLVMKNLYSPDYKVLRSIAKNHLHVLEKRSLGISRSFRFRLLLAYLREYPLSDFRGFTEDFPAHWASAVCHIEPFLKALETRELASLASFLSTCHQSMADEIVVYALAFPVNDYLFDQKSKLNPEDRQRIEELERTAHRVTTGFSGESPGAVMAYVKEQIRTTAPANRSYRVLVNALSYLTGRNEWDLCLELVRYAKPFFPDDTYEECYPSYFIINKKQVWFDKMIRRLEVPAENPETAALTAISTPLGSEFAPVVSVDDEQLYFATDWQKRVWNEDVYHATRKDSLWGKALQVKALSRKTEEHPRYLTPDGVQMVLSIDNRLHLSTKDLSTGRWSRPKLVSPAFDELAWIGAATLSRDGRVLIFEGSERPRPVVNEYEEIDLYISRYDAIAEAWSAPALLSGGVNTPWEDRSPFLHADGRTLLFSSRGHYGFDGLDVFMTTRLDDTWEKWSPPVNLGKEVNAYDDDWAEQFSLVASGKKAYLSTRDERLETPGDLLAANLPTYARPPRMVVLKGTIIDQTPATRMKLQTVFPTAGEPLDSCRVLPGGHFQFLLPEEEAPRAYLYADDPGIYSTVVEMELAGLPDVSRMDNPPLTIPIGRMIAQEIPVPLENPRFAGGSTVLTSDLKRDLDWMVHYFIDSEKRTFLVGGYSDGEGSPAEQEALSLARAEAVKAYLIERGLPWDRIWTQGFADKKPLEEGAGPGKNRRVEIIIK